MDDEPITALQLAPGELDADARLELVGKEPRLVGGIKGDPLIWADAVAARLAAVALRARWPDDRIAVTAR